MIYFDWNPKKFFCINSNAQNIQMLFRRNSFVSLLNFYSVCLFAIWVSYSLSYFSNPTATVDLSTQLGPAPEIMFPAYSAFS